VPRITLYECQLGYLVVAWDIGVEDMSTAVRHTVDILLITVPLFVMTYFLFDPSAFNAFTAWLARTL
jgi:hypothetical protein